MEAPDGLLCAQLIQEFLEFYKMDFTLQVFLPECNLQNEGRVREKIEIKLGLKKTFENPAEPVLMQLIKMVQQDGSIEPLREKMGGPAPNPAFSSTKYGGFPTDEMLLQEKLLYILENKQKKRKILFHHQKANQDLSLKTYLGKQNLQRQQSRTLKRMKKNRRRKLLKKRRRNLILQVNLYLLLPVTFSQFNYSRTKQTCTNRREET
eukprot:TRINITY_DN10588_c0_g1_i1.p2 TRINITY_DN10588_c0_g1~~TRINITY_DN10588_c0_g1_i1.p2  ORF type:complete len:207 (+),score=24.84 TRINITY_DN10588_c0_g1_i1:258-878(+)